MRFVPRCVLPLLAVLAGVVPSARAAEVRSPDGRIVVAVDVDERGIPEYSVSYRGETIMPAGKLGLRFQSQPAFDGDFRISGTSSSSHDETWEQPWGERRFVRDQHNELLVNYESAAGPARHFSLRVRVFDDGFGFRYEVPEQPGYGAVNITDEVTEFRVADDPKTTAWWIPGRRWNRYEYLYNTTPLADIQMAHTPMTLRLANGVHLSFHEAALVDYAAYVLDQRRAGIFRTSLTPWSDGIRVKTHTPFKTPWRTVQVAPTAAALLNSSLILNLNEPNVLGDVSWVEPGKYVGIWWAMHLGQATWESGPKHGATTAETKRYIDFAGANGFKGVLVEGWNVGWDGDWFNNGKQFRFTEPHPDFDLKAVADYALGKGVRLIGHHETAADLGNYEPQMQAALDLYESLGVRQVKTGYVADAGDIRRIDENGVELHEWHDGQYTVAHHIRLLKEAARRKISIIAHEPVKDTGLRRTYPNWLSREGARGQEYNAWGSPVNPPEHTAILPFTRMLAGPMDYTPGIVDLTFEGPDGKHRVKNTLAKELSLYVVLYSPVQMAADLPGNYPKHPQAFRFIKEVPTDWDDSRAIAGEVGDYVAIARKQRGADDWYVGALTDERSRKLALRLDFLDPQSRYVAEIYRDGAKADWRTRPYDMVVEERPVTAADTLELRLAASGGAAIRFRRMH
ncbi:MAG: glycoside hydrolase family 97 protein [Gammaproteobacteria bacterium]|nr:glycoside hydrolase family 97 protein [Gammaproteobacteria bacterium]